MIITADSGSTSVDWRILRRGEPVRRLVSPGVNPVLQGVGTMREVFEAALAGVSDSDVRVYFYGAGVVSAEVGEKVREALQTVLPGCAVTVGSDLEAAAIALLGDKDGVAAILGTGSNSGLYLGGRITRSIPAGGFILGDEGSGAWFGKMLLADYIKGLLPGELEAALQEECPRLDYPSVVGRVYGGEMPSRYLASFSLFLGRRKECPYVRELITRGFRLFLERNVLRYGRVDLPLAAVGSVACAYSDILREVAVECGVKEVMTAPGAGDGLERYYLKKM